MDAIQGIGDVLVFETKRRNRNKTIIQGLKRIEKIIKEFFCIQKDDPDRFDRLLIAQEYFDLYREDEEEARWRLAFDPEKYLVSFSTAVNQILRIHEAAIETANDEISRFATYHLNWLLADISQRPKNHLFVEQLLKKLMDITRIAIAKQDVSMYSASFHWYVDIVFNKLRAAEHAFDISYLELFDRYFFSSVRNIISENQFPLFENLISSLVDGMIIPSSGVTVWEYGHLVLHSDLGKYKELDKQYSIESRIKELHSSEKDLDTNENLDNWLKKFDEFKSILEPHFNKEEIKRAKEIEKDIKEFVVSQFKYNNLLNIVFAIGSYCLFKEKPDYIKYLWEYKQPPNSDAIWIGHDIVPNSINDVLGFYFKKDLFDRKLSFWEAHHGSTSYYKKYFLLLICRLIKTITPNSDGVYEEIDNYTLPELNIYRLSDLKYSIDEFIVIANELKVQNSVMRTLGFGITEIEELFNNKLIPFLHGLKAKAKERIKSLQRDQNTSPRKIEEFKEQVLKEFNKSVVIRNIFKYYGLYEDKTEQKYEGPTERFGKFSIENIKPAFFEEWHVHYIDLGSQFGRTIAAGENSNIAERIESYCKEINKADLEKTLETHHNLDELIVLTTHDALYSFFESSQNFKPKWYKDSPQPEVRRFKGWYVLKDHNIPVFEIYYRKPSNQFMILNKNKLGKLIQQSPLNPGDKEELKKDLFYMNIQALSENQELMTKLLEKPTEGLIKIGDRGKQEGYLKERILIEILERFEFAKSENFDGYLCKLGKE